VAVTKVSLTLDSDLVREARERVGPRELSAYVNAALRQRLQHDRLAEFLAAADDEAGAVPEEDIEAARRWFRP
jgi:Arc/MetJ family transcription regulator